MQRSSSSVAIKKRRVTPRKPSGKPTPVVPTNPPSTAAPTAASTVAPAPTDQVATPTAVQAQPSPTPLPTKEPTIEPTKVPQGRTVTISGEVQASDSSLLSGATIGIGGTGRFFPIASNGAYQFDSRARGSGLSLVVKVGGRRAGALIPPLPVRYTRAIYGLKLGEGVGGKLSLKLRSAQLIE